MVERKASPAEPVPEEPGDGTSPLELTPHSPRPRCPHWPLLKLAGAGHEPEAEQRPRGRSFRECRQVNRPSAPTEAQARPLRHSHLRTRRFGGVGGTSRDRDGRHRSWTRPRGPTRASRALPADWAGAVHLSRLTIPAVSYPCHSQPPPSTAGPSKDPGARGQSWGLTLVWAFHCWLSGPSGTCPALPRTQADDGRAVNTWAPGSDPRALPALGQASSLPRPAPHGPAQRSPVWP